MYTLGFGASTDRIWDWGKEFQGDAGAMSLIQNLKNGKFLHGLITWSSSLSDYMGIYGQALIKWAYGKALITWASSDTDFQVLPQTCSVLQTSLMIQIYLELIQNYLELIQDYLASWNEYKVTKYII